MADDATARKFPIAERMKAARAAVEPIISQTALASLVAHDGAPKCNANRVSRLEAGYADATWAEVVSIGKALGVSPEWLAGITTEARSPAADDPPSGSSTPKEPDLVDLNQLSRDKHPSDYAYRQFLIRVIATAREKLAMTGLAPAIWRHWREVQRKASAEVATIP